MLKYHFPINYGYISISKKTTENAADAASFSEVVTVMSNLLYYGFVLNTAGVAQLKKLPSSELNAWWEKMEPALKSYTLEDLDMASGVVYKNFPNDVLATDDATRLHNQFMVYMGVTSSHSEEEEREARKSFTGRKVLAPLTEAAEKQIVDSLVKSQVKWDENQIEMLKHYSKTYKIAAEDIVFNDNFVEYALSIATKPVRVKNPMNILRIAEWYRANGIKMNKGAIKRIIRMIERTQPKNLASTLPSKEKEWKSLFRILHFQTYSKSAKHCKVVSDFHEGKLRSTNSMFRANVEKVIVGDNTGYAFLEKYAGMYLRSVREIYTRMDAKNHGKLSDSLVKVVPTLTIKQLASLKNMLVSFTGVNEHVSEESVETKIPKKKTSLSTLQIKVKRTKAITKDKRLIPPSGNWSKVRMVEDEMSYFDKTFSDKIVDVIDQELAKHFNKRFPNGVHLDESMKDVYIASFMNCDLAVGRGTKFPIPNNTKFLRLANYWSATRTVWFDIGVTALDGNFQFKDECSWASSKCKDDYMIFSGDPVTNDKNINGTQIVDVDIQKAKSNGTRYVLFATVGYSDLEFEGHDVHSTVQFLTDNTTGKLFDPKDTHYRVKMGGEHKHSLNLLFDLEEMKYIILDQNVGLNGYSIGHANNVEFLNEMLPLYMKKLQSGISVHDLLASSVSQREDAVKFLETDKDAAITDDECYVLIRKNTNTSSEQIVLESLLED